MQPMSPPRPAFKPFPVTSTPVSIRPALCLALCLLVFFVGLQGVSLLKQELDLAGPGLFDNPAVLVAILVIYGVLIAIPFVPGAELGFFLLMIIGKDIAVPLYLVTVLSLGASYGIGRLVPLNTATAFVKSILPGRLSDRVARKLLGCAEDFSHRTDCTSGGPNARLRCLSLVVLFNMPGNSVLGGGGGIAMMSGVGRILDPFRFALVLLVAIAPVPFGVLLFGI